MKHQIVSQILIPLADLSGLQTQSMSVLFSPSAQCSTHLDVDDFARRRHFARVSGGNELVVTGQEASEEILQQIEFAETRLNYYSGVLHFLVDGTKFIRHRPV